MSNRSRWPYDAARLQRERGGEPFTSADLAARYGITKQQASERCRDLRTRGNIACVGVLDGRPLARAAKLYVCIQRPRSVRA